MGIFDRIRCWLIKPEPGLVSDELVGLVLEESRRVYESGGELTEYPTSEVDGTDIFIVTDFSEVRLVPCSEPL